jgi:hypothetical protein
MPKITSPWVRPAHVPVSPGDIYGLTVHGVTYDVTIGGLQDEDGPWVQDLKIAGEWHGIDEVFTQGVIDTFNEAAFKMLTADADA